MGMNQSSYNNLFFTFNIKFLNCSFPLFPIHCETIYASISSYLLIKSSTFTLHCFLNIVLLVGDLLVSLSNHFISERKLPPDSPEAVFLPLFLHDAGPSFPARPSSTKIPIFSFLPFSVISVSGARVTPLPPSASRTAAETRIFPPGALASSRAAVFTVSPIAV